MRSAARESGEAIVNSASLRPCEGAGEAWHGGGVPAGAGRSQALGAGCNSPELTRGVLCGTPTAGRERGAG
eukprot:scaffold41496_cov26-Tisochrysis_lutea.AAC.2